MTDKPDALLPTVDQTVLGIGNPRGNCLQAALATLMDLPLDSVLDITDPAIDEGNWHEALCAWGESIGWHIWSTAQCPKVGYYIANGPTEKRQGKHAVVCKDGEMYHDPHPSRDGLVAADYFICAEKRPQPPAPQDDRVAEGWATSAAQHLCAPADQPAAIHLLTSAFSRCIAAAQAPIVAERDAALAKASIFAEEQYKVDSEIIDNLKAKLAAAEARVEELRPYTADEIELFQRCFDRKVIGLDELLGTKTEALAKARAALATENKP